MSRDPVDRVLEHNMQVADESAPKRGYDPIFNPPNPEATVTTGPLYDPNQIFEGKHFGQPATGDGE